MRKTMLQRQADSRRLLRKVVQGYVNLRAGDGAYNDTIQTTDRLGRKVVVFIRLEILSDEG